MKVIFMGTPDFAIPSLEVLHKNHEVLAVITQPDKPKGRGKKLLSSPVKDKSLEFGLKVFQPENINDSEFINEIRVYNADVFVVAAYGQILSEEILAMPMFGCINVHGSLLPKYRGASPIQMSIINGEKKTGITIMYMEKGLDTGDIILKLAMGIEEDDTYGSLNEKLSILGANALLKSIDLIENGTAVRQRQDDSLSTYAPLITKGMGLIDWNGISKDIINLIRGLNPKPGAYTIIDDEVIKIWNAMVFDSTYDGKSPGEIVDITKKGFVVKTCDGSILVTKIQAKGGKSMDTGSYLRGHEIRIGTLL